ncbi:formate/nitrite transporter family protein [Rhizomicrobium electricum]|uniref:Formate/nitrite transporter family protein n=1 Tax=Rhizomicrobium electricum TaxID=480070 RepID=A0ABN1F2Y1_9PROT|nr:formate/nitrite transporter family protein [Rhizomicrobium electricum]NIJ50335.1 formate/nitrite transporter FocA (FNT family) [Rhizomicrobium electricum]
MPDNDTVEPSFGGAAQLDNLSDKQKQQVETQTRPNAALIHETIRAEGVSELERAAWALAASGLAAGLSMGFSFITEGLLAHALPAGPARTILAPLGYTIGFLIVVLGRQQLFTENTLTPVLPLLHNRNGETLVKVLRLWAIVLVANLAGALAIAAILAHVPLFESGVYASLADLAGKTIQDGFGVTFARAVFAGWLIALMVWLLPAAEGARPTIIAVITYVIALAQFSHIIAGSVDCAYLAFAGMAGWDDFVLRFFLPTLLGNICGGVALVAALNYGQVAKEVENNK